jgi:hypothetical protein
MGHTGEPIACSTMQSSDKKRPRETHSPPTFAGRTLSRPGPVRSLPVDGHPSKTYRFDTARQPGQEPSHSNTTVCKAQWHDVSAVDALLISRQGVTVA